MKAIVTYKFDASDFLAKMNDAMDRGVLAAAQVGAETARSWVGVRHGGVPSKPGGPWNTQTGNARRAITAAKTGTLRAGFGTNVPYVRHLEFGAIVRPKTAKSLFIPVGDGKKLFKAPALPKAVMEALKAEGKVFTLRTGGKAVIMLKYGRGGKQSKPIAVLRKTAVIRPRPLFRQVMVNKRVQKLMEDKFVRVAKMAVTSSKVVE